MRMYDIIAHKRDGLELTEEEISFFIDGLTSGEIPDYQTTALLMSIYINGMSDSELLNFTFAMRDSGRVVDLKGIQGQTVDKHSTGGVGDKTTMIVVPIAAAIGCKVVKMSGRGLGHTGGTVDKLESIPGFQTELSEQDIVKVVNKVGACMIGHSTDVAPADQKLYELRDVTATVNSLPLIASSVMCKKLACGSNCILLDVKFGSGALMRELDEAISLASEMVKIGKAASRKVAAILTNMDIPLGNAVGNTLEVIEAVKVLKGEEQGDLYDICIELAAYMAQLTSGLPIEECRKLCVEAIRNGTAFEKFKQIVKLQGGDTSYLDDTSRFKEARYYSQVRATRRGYISYIDTQLVGEASMHLGAGRFVKEDDIDHAAGIVFERKTGDYVKAGDVIATLYTNDDRLMRESAVMFHSSLRFSDMPPVLPPLVYRVIK